MVLSRRSFASTILATSSFLSADALYQKGSPVQLLDAAAFKKKVIGSEAPFMVEFFASWCGHCKQLAPEYEKAAKATKGVIGFVAVEDQAAMQEYGVQGFPTIKWFGANKSKPEDYRSGRDAKSMVEFAMKKVNDMVSSKIGGGNFGGSSSGGSGGGSGGSGGSGGGDTVVLTDSNFDDLVMKDSKNVWFVKFYAPWCGHCKAMAGDWDKTATAMKGKVKVAKMDATTETGVPGRFGVRGFPTIKLFPAGPKSDSSAVDYNEGRDAGSLQKFAEKYFMMTVEAEQLLSQEMFDEKCSGGQLCLIAFLPHIMESSAKERKKYLELYNTAARSAGGVPASFYWSQGGDQYELEEKLNLGFGFPALVAISRKKNIFVTHRGSFTESAVRTFITGLSAPKHLNDLPKDLPKLVKQKAWDGKDAPKEDEEL
ncbi:unnamed protein product [Amoebophrya sp. A120]|nr:unnamed protein product [Amoebophrya sp. A120]|eukprot:GSA120T00008477001.1